MSERIALIDRLELFMMLVARRTAFVYDWLPGVVQKQVVFDWLPGVVREQPDFDWLPSVVQEQTTEGIGTARSEDKMLKI